MINYVYQLVAPKLITVKYEDLDFENKVVVHPEYLAICNADVRYYSGSRSPEAMAKKLPMALIHECSARVVSDPKGEFKPGDKVVLIPNVLSDKEDNYRYENYKSGGFLSSGLDGFMREYVALPHNRVVRSETDQDLAAITEFVSVAFHASERLLKISETPAEKIGIWGDGNLGYVTALVTRYLYPKSEIHVIGTHSNKLSLFSFAKTHLFDEIPKDLRVDHAFECVGGQGSGSAVNSIIEHINSQGTVLLMGVSENHVPVNTRDVLEKGLVFAGSSRSGRKDFENAAKLLAIPEYKRRFRSLISEVVPIHNISDIDKAFERNMINQYKTVLEWNI